MNSELDISENGIKVIVPEGDGNYFPFEAIIPWDELYTIAIWRTFRFDSDTTFLFFLTKDGDRYIFNTNSLTTNQYKSVELQFEDLLGVSIDAHFSIPTVVYPKSVFGCSLFENNWWFKIKWNLFSPPNGLSSVLSRCLREDAGDQVSQ
jgi:hypothetical protein